MIQLKCLNLQKMVKSGVFIITKKDLKISELQKEIQLLSETNQMYRNSIAEMKMLFETINYNLEL